GDDGDAARAQLAQLLHARGIAVDVDRLVVDAVLGEELLGAQAAGAPGLPEDAYALACDDHGDLRGTAGFVQYPNADARRVHEAVLLCVAAGGPDIIFAFTNIRPGGGGESD